MNNVCLVGRLGRNPEIRHTNSGMKVAGFSLAVDGGKKDAPAMWIDIVCFDKTADIVEKWFKKGKPVGVTGRLSHRTWEAKDGGGKRSKHEVVATLVHFVGDSNRASDNGGYGDPNAGNPQGGDQPSAPIDDEDIPF